MEGGRLVEERVRSGLTAKEGRRFAFPVGTAFAVLAGILLWREKMIASYVLAGVSGALLLAGLVIPSYLGPVQRAWMGFAHALSRVTTPVFMSAMYFLVFTPFGVVLRLVGHRPLKKRALGGSYWQTRAPEQRRSDLERQFQLSGSMVSGASR